MKILTNAMICVCVLAAIVFVQEPMSLLALVLLKGINDTAGGLTLDPSLMYTDGQPEEEFTESDQIGYIREGETVKFKDIKKEEEQPEREAAHLKVI